MFQVASQFNLLEVVGPEVAPEDGIARHATDRTQGPACAMACAAGTIFRNYFAPVDGGVGQTSERQLDMRADLGRALGNAGGQLWQMRNGYALPRGNPSGWITVAIAGAIGDYRAAPLGVRIVSHGQPDPDNRSLLLH